MDKIVAQETVSIKQVHIGLVNIVAHFGEKNVYLYKLGENMLVCVFMSIPKSFLDKFGTGVQRTDEFLWDIEVRRVISNFCQPKKNSY